MEQRAPPSQAGPARLVHPHDGIACPDAPLSPAFPPLSPQFLRAVSEGVVAYLLDVEDLKRPVARSVCRELLAACVLRPLMQVRGWGLPGACQAACQAAAAQQSVPVPHLKGCTPHTSTRSGPPPTTQIRPCMLRCESRRLPRWAHPRKLWARAASGLLALPTLRCHPPCLAV